MEHGRDICADNGFLARFLLIHPRSLSHTVLHSQPSLATNIIIIIIHTMIQLMIKLYPIEYCTIIIRSSWIIELLWFVGADVNSNNSKYAHLLSSRCVMLYVMLCPMLWWGFGWWWGDIQWWSYVTQCLCFCCCSSSSSSTLGRMESLFVGSLLYYSTTLWWYYIIFETGACGETISNLG